MVEIRTLESASLADAELAQLRALFEASYRDADPEYLDKSRATFRHLAVAEADGELQGFAFGDSVRSALPRMDGEQSVALAGMACIRPELRRQGLFMRLSTAAMVAGGGVDPAHPFLFAGRMAHVVTYRTMVRLSPSTVPAEGKPPGPWHREVAVAVARLLDAEVDPQTFVVPGSGRPIGFPRIEYTASAAEQALFAAVDRRRGDSLLSMCWLPRAPDNW